MPTLAEIRMAVAAAALLGAFAAGFAFEHRLAASKYTSLELSYAQAQAKAVAEAQAEQARLDSIALAAAHTEADTQARIAAGTAARLSEVKSHVSSHQPCVTWGLIRLLDAAVLHRSALSLVPPAGKSDDACSPYAAAELASNIIGNYGAANANAEQLNALIAAIRASQKK